MPRRKKVSKLELISYLDAAVRNAQGADGGDIADDRSKAMDYYLGEMDEYLPASEGRSRVKMRDVLEVVEWVLPSLMRIFADADNALVFTADGPEDEAAVKHETEAVKTIVFERNDAFLNMYTFFKDALLTKTGICKVAWEPGEWLREDYSGLLQEQIAGMLSDPGLEYELLREPEVDGLLEDGAPTFSISLRCRRKSGDVLIEPVPPEQFGVSRSAVSSKLGNVDFCYHWKWCTQSELVEEGFPAAKLDRLADDQWVEDEQELARKNLSDEQFQASAAVHKSMRRIRRYECYIRIDRDGDGVAELLRVTMAGMPTWAEDNLLEVEEVDRIPFISVSPIPLTHKWAGLSLADMVTDIQEIRTTLVRQFLDNLYINNNGRTAINERVSLNDLLMNRPGGIVRTKGIDPPSNHIFPIPHSPIPQESFGLLEVLDGVLKRRTGVGEEVMGLDTASLANIQTGVAMAAYEAAHMRIELMARVFAELGLKPMFLAVHELLRKHQDIPTLIKINREWVPIAPNEWKERTDMDIDVGIGSVSREMRQMRLQQAIQHQMAIMQFGPQLPPHIYHSSSQYLESLGLEPSLFLPDPNQPPPPPQPDPAQLQMQMMQMQMQMEQQKGQLELQAKQLELQAKQADSQIRGQEAQAKLRAIAINEQSQLAQAENEAQKAQQDMALAMRKQIADETKAELDREMEKYKADLSALVDLVDQLRQQQAQEAAEEVAENVTDEGGNDAP